MTELDDGGTAFPRTIQRWNDTFESVDGMSLRDWFAGQALPHVITEIMRGNLGDHPVRGGGPAGFAATAYDIADAMLAARKKGSSDE